MCKFKKRDGSLVDFDGSKIINALSKAYAEKGKTIDVAMWNEFIENKFPQSDNSVVYAIENVQDCIQRKLIETDYEVGIAFLLYRVKRKTDRELANEQFEFVRKYINSNNTANATIDDNSNVANKNVGVLNAEIHKSRNVNSNREWEKRKLRELFPDEHLDKEYIRGLKSHVYYKNDENSFPFPVPYCVAGSMYPFLLHGIEKLGGKSTKPMNIDSFCGMYINLVFALSGMFAGAVALPETLVYFDYFARKEWGDDYYQNPDRIITADWVKRPMTVKKQIHQYFQQIVHSINQPSGARGQQSAFVNFSIFDKYFFEGMFGNFYFDAETMEQPKWESVQWLQEVFMEWFNAERLRTVLTFPVVSVAMLVDKENLVAKDSRMEDFVCKEWAEGDSFFVYLSESVDSLSSCCRLKNKIQTKEFNFTNGNMGVETGSKSVISLNLSRIMQNFFREVVGDKEAVAKNRVATLRSRWSEYQDYLRNILDKIYKYHTAYNENLFDLQSAGLLPAYDAGFIDLNKQYLTVGLNGLNQSAEFVGITCSDNEDYQWYCSNLFETIKTENTSHGVKFNGHKLTFNTEQVPAESLAVKNYNWDKADGYWVPEDTNLYASYIYKPNDANVQILEKIRLHGDRFIGDFLDGGSAAHLNLDAHLSFQQYKYILRYAIKEGCSYLTFNVPNSECQDCGYITKHPIKVCPKCGSIRIEYYDRVIGYLTKTKYWSEGRQIEQKLRIYENGEKNVPSSGTVASMAIRNALFNNFCEEHKESDFSAE